MKGSNPRFKWPGWGMAVLLAAGAAGIGAAAAESGGRVSGTEMKILARFTVPGVSAEAPMDIRWAGDDSVYLALHHSGVKEVSLAQPLREIRTLVPPVATLKGPQDYRNLAVSPRFLAVAAGSFKLAWRPTAGPNNGAVGFYVQPVNTMMDIDVAGNRVVLLGDGRSGKASATGGIAFEGRLSATGLQNYRPLLSDETEGMSTFSRCASMKMGAVRFLADGSFVVVPGFQPGAFLFNAAGQLAHTWSGQETSLSTDCSNMSKQESDILWARAGVAPLTGWMNRQRLLDDVLPLPQGPGLLIRTAGPDGRTSWELRILRANETAAVYTLPIAGGSEDRLSGDVRNGRMVFLKSSWRNFHHGSQASEILVLEAPGAGPEVAR